MPIQPQCNDSPRNFGENNPVDTISIRQAWLNIKRMTSMFELKKRLIDLKTRATTLIAALFCHRAIYGGLALCYGTECLHAAEPAHYSAVALLYAILSLKG